MSWLDDKIASGETVWYRIPGGAPIKPIRKVNDNYYLGLCYGKDMLFTESEVVAVRIASLEDDGQENLL